MGVVFVVRFVMVELTFTVDAGDDATGDHRKAGGESTSPAMTLRFILGLAA